MSKKTLLIILIFNIFALPLLILGGIFWILGNNGILIYLFGQIGGTPVFSMLAIGVIIEGIMLFVLAIVHKQFAIFVPNIALGFLAFILMFIALFSRSYTYEIQLDSFNETLVIDNESLLVAGRSVIYEKTSFCTVKRVSSVMGDDGDKPLDDPKYYKLTEYANGFTIEHGGLAPEIIYIQYKDGSFYEVKSLNDII